MQSRAADALVAFSWMYAPVLQPCWPQTLCIFQLHLAAFREVAGHVGSLPAWSRVLMEAFTCCPGRVCQLCDRHTEALSGTMTMTGTRLQAGAGRSGCGGQLRAAVPGPAPGEGCMPHPCPAPSGAVCSRSRHAGPASAQDDSGSERCALAAASVRPKPWIVNQVTRGIAPSLSLGGCRCCTASRACRQPPCMCPCWSWCCSQPWTPPSLR